MRQNSLLTTTSCYSHLLYDMPLLLFVVTVDDAIVYIKLLSLLLNINISIETICNQVINLYYHFYHDYSHAYIFSYRMSSCANF